MTPGRPAVVGQTRRRLSRHGTSALVAMLVPAVLFPLGLFLLRGDARFAWLGDIRAYPWELWAVAACGTAATLGGALDWRFHRSGETVVGRREHRAHLLALAGGGVPLFALMAVASINSRPARFLVPVLVVLIYTVVVICYDEFVFHRRCGRFETFTHRLLTCGNGLAFLAWAHWCFVRGLP
ncbi:MAG TPA: hypothetical protein VFE78_26715 [Gemmataceae bacterium]|jgi:hypothetical protein|nr:hypothetical protein [Gemmataceae bacterium]